MPNIFSISNSSQDLDRDLDNLGDEIQEKLEKSEAGGKRGGGGPSRSKTNKAISEEARENAESSRRKQSKEYIKKSLSHLPETDNPDTNEKQINTYSDWLLKSFDFNQPYINEKDLEYSQVKSSGPGGQNVNKVSNGVRFVHKITGISAVSRDSRSTPENERKASLALYENLCDVVKNWKLVLSGIEKDKYKEAIETFILKSLEK